MNAYIIDTETTGVTDTEVIDCGQAEVFFDTDKQIHCMGKFFAQR
jgi:hypothetical protein